MGGDGEYGSGGEEEYWQIYLDEPLRSRINQSVATDCRTIRPSSTANKTVLN